MIVRGIKARQGASTDELDHPVDPAVAPSIYAVMRIRGITWGGARSPATTVGR